MGAGTFVFFLAVAVAVFIFTQILPPQDVWLSSLLPFAGAYGEDQLAVGLTYIQVLEASGFISFAGLYVYSYGRASGASRPAHAGTALALPMMVFGALISVIVYVETHLLWGEVWYGIKFANVYPQGFPWGNERVASNTCFLHGSNYVPAYGANCVFFNYDQLLLVAAAVALAGWLVSGGRYWRILHPGLDRPTSRRPKEPAPPQ